MMPCAAVQKIYFSKDRIKCKIYHFFYIHEANQFFIIFPAYIDVN